VTGGWKAIDEVATLIGIAAANLTSCRSLLIVLGGSVPEQEPFRPAAADRGSDRPRAQQDRDVLARRGGDALGSLLVATTEARERLRPHLKEGLSPA
jgi:hypothetical protein